MSLSTAVLLVAMIPTQVAGPTTEQSTTEAQRTAEEIRQAVQRLGSASFSARQEASDFLWRCGLAARPALDAALDSDDPEVTFRARQILDQFRLGIFTDTPPQVVRLIEMYRSGDLGVKRTALQQLRERGSVKAMLTLLHGETNDTFREQLIREFARDAEIVVPDLIVAGELAEAEELLELTASSTDEGMRHLAVLLLLTGKLEQRIEAEREALSREREGKGSPDLKLRLLVYLLRASGKRMEALAVAERLDDRFDFMGESLRYELRDWRGLARLYDETIRSNAALVENTEYVAYSAAFHRLAGDAEGLVRDVAKLKQFAATGDEDAAFSAAEALFVNGLFDEGIDLLRESNQESAFRLLAARMRYREAFALVGVDPHGDNTEWFRDLARDLHSSDDALRNRLGLGFAVARTLGRLGERDRAAEGLSIIGESLLKDGNGTRLALLCQTERKLGLTAQAFDHATEALAKGPEGGALDELFDEQADAAQVWWQFFLPQQDRESTRTRLGRVAAMLAVADPADADEKQPAGDAWRANVDRAAEQALKFDAPQRDQWLRALAETCLLHGDSARAKELLAAGDVVSGTAALRLADLYAKEEAWPQAAHWYQHASTDAEHRPLALYMQGHALEKSGEMEEGLRLKQLARLLPLAEASKRRLLAEGLKERGLLDDAVREWELILCTSAFRDWYSSNAAMNLGNALSGKDHLAAADNWETLALSVLKPGSAFIEVEGYLQLPHLVHKSRARGLLAAGKHDEALANLQIGLAAYPGNIDLAEDLIPDLEAAGLKSAADDLFAKVYPPNEQVCVDYPENASAHNNLAWLAARSGRRLPEALAHAQLAVKLEPENAAYLDTLAEALYRTGSRDEAIKLAQRCLEKEPDNEHFQQQLARFQAGE